MPKTDGLLNRGHAVVIRPVTSGNLTLATKCTTMLHMKRSEVYSWRVSPELKVGLEDAARSEGTSVARLLDRIVTEWLAGFRDEENDDEEQRRIHKAATKCFGKLQGGDPHLAERASSRVKDKLEEKYGRHRPH